MKTIELTQNKVVIVDDEDYEYLNQFKWNFHIYAFRMTHNNKIRKTIYMHRLINNTPNGLGTDHINHNTLDNRKDNLRTATKSQNAQNGLKRKNKSSIYKGVSWYKNVGKWAACIRVDRERLYLGCSDNEKDMARTYNKAALKYFGEFATLNEI